MLPRSYRPLVSALTIHSRSINEGGADQQVAPPDDSVTSNMAFTDNENAVCLLWHTWFSQVRLDFIREAVARPALPPATAPSTAPAPASGCASSAGGSTSGAGEPGYTDHPLAVGTALVAATLRDVYVALWVPAPAEAGGGLLHPHGALPLTGC